MTTVARVAENVQWLLGSEADRLGRETGFIQRQVKLTGSRFAQMMVFGTLNSPEITYTDMSQDAALIGVPMSAQGLAQRFTERAACFLSCVLERAVTQVVSGKTVAVPILRRFNGVYIRDSSVISLAKELRGVWRGVGGTSGETAALKLQVRLNYSTGELHGPALQAGRAHDAASPFQHHDEPVGSLALHDLGYFRLDDIQERDREGKYVLTRYKQGTVLRTQDGRRLDLLDWLRSLRTSSDIPVLVGNTHRIAMRLLAFPVPQNAADRRRQRLREYARKKQVTPKAETYALTAWTLLLTNVPTEQLSLEEAWTLLRVRWQVELLFKLWKSHIHIDEWRSQNPWRILCEIYAKLIASVIMHWIFLIDWAQYPDRSLFKAAQAVQKLAIPMVHALRNQDRLVEVLNLFRSCLHAACRLDRRRTQPATFQLLLLIDNASLA
jgi:hypothetical protein